MRCYMRPLLVLGACSFKFNLFLLLRETHDLLANTGSSPILLLVFKVENFRTRGTTSIVHDALGQDTDQGALARVDITDHSDPHVILLSDR